MFYNGLTFVQGGEWVKAEDYLSGFIKVPWNNYSRKIYFEMRKQKYLEALNR
jgi:periodic tryptophan protein 2